MKIRVYIFSFILIQNQCSGQNDCAMYKKILEDIPVYYFNNTETYLTPQGGIDPENPVFIPDSITINEQRAIKYYIVNNKLEFNVSTLKNWFRIYLNDTLVNENKIFKVKSSKIQTCKFGSKYPIIDFRDKLHFTVDDYDTKKIKNKIINYTPTKVTFSEILAYENKAVVFAHVVIGDSYGYYIFRYIFEKKKRKWQIKKCDVEFR